MSAEQRELKPCPFCGVALVANTNQADLYVKRYGTHYDHPTGLCFLADAEISPAQIEEWNTRPAIDAALPGVQKIVGWKFLNGVVVWKEDRPAGEGWRPVYAAHTAEPPINAAAQEPAKKRVGIPNGLLRGEDE
jgi:hypothetical protein